MSKATALPKVMDREPAAHPLRILVLYSRVPFPMMRGDQLTVSHLLSYFKARGHVVDFYTTDVDGDMTTEQKRWLDEACNSVIIAPQSKQFKLLGLIKGAFALRPLQVGLFDNTTISAAAEAGVKAGNYDIIYCYYLRSITAVPGGFAPDQVQVFCGRRTAAFLAMQLSQTLNTRRIYENATGIGKRLVYGLEAWLMQRLEARIWQKFTKVMLIGPKDVEAVEAACVAEGQQKIANWLYGAHGTNVEAFKPADPSEVMADRIIFSGSMLYQPNVQAVQWFHEHCWPAIKAARPNAEWYIVGRDPLPEVTALGKQDGITVTGTVPDVGEHIRKATVCINPMLAAGGMQNKLIEYMACAKAVVATKVANEGILAPPGQALEIADHADDFTGAVLALLGDPKRAESLGLAAREFVLENWTWESHFDKLENEFFKAVGGRKNP